MDRSSARLLGGVLADRLLAARSAYLAIPAGGSIMGRDPDVRTRRRWFLRGMNADLAGLHALLRLSRASGIMDFAPARTGSRRDARQRTPSRVREKVASVRVRGEGLGRLKNGNPAGDFRLSPRCGAKTRCGGACRQPAMANERCRLHGGKSTGARTAAGRARIAAANTRHGKFTNARRGERRAVRETVRALRAATADVRALVYGPRRAAPSPYSATAPGARRPGKPLGVAENTEIAPLPHAQRNVARKTAKPRGPACTGRAAGRHWPGG